MSNDFSPFDISDNAKTTRTARLAMALFFIQPFAMGTWLALIPEVMAALDLNKAQLALALLGMPLALVPTLQIAARMTARFGPRRTMSVAFPAQTVALFFIFMAGGQGQLFMALAVFGAVVAFLQMGLNVYAGRLEKASGVYVMSRCHGFWALGLMSGSAVVVGLTALTPFLTAVAIGVPAAVIGVMLARRLPRIGGDGSASDAPPRRARRDIPPSLWLISLLVLGVSLTEGAMGDWAAVYMTERLGGDAARGALAVTVYYGALAAGRFVGDALKTRWGVVSLARGTLILALAGVSLLVLPLPVWAAWIGFVALGVGVSVGFPLGVSAVAALDDRYETANIAIMTTVAISGFLIGPPVIGFLAEAFSLQVGLSVLLPVLAMSLYVAPRLGVGESP